ncbi:MAG: hypothetical protein JKY71_02580 [Alphaproteobacteria bacterium]|nr:hypothetical protein [Alphaproteobacteria bacterium]
MRLDKDAIHPLVKQPTEVSMASRDAIIAAYHEKISALTGVFQKSHDLWNPPVPVTVYYYSDNGGRLDDTAPKEIQRFLNDSANAVSALSGIAPPRIEQANTPAQAWVQGGFDLAQTTRHGLSGVGNVTFLNCAPRIDERGQEGNVSNKGEPVYVGVLPNGHVVSANSRYNFTFFRDAIENGEMEVFAAAVQPDGTQFRSRDTFPMHSVLLANQLTQNIDKWKPEMSIEERRELLAATGYVDLDAPLTAEDIPALKQFSVAHIDVHGNIKLNTRTSELDPDVVAQLKDEPFKIQINGQTLDARFTDRMFDRAEGEAGFSVGSSGRDWQGAANHDGFIELSIIGGDAAEAFAIEAGQFKKPIELTIPGITTTNDNVDGGPRPVLQRGHDSGGALEAHA